MTASRPLASPAQLTKRRKEWWLDGESSCKTDCTCTCGRSSSFQYRHLGMDCGVTDLARELYCARLSYSCLAQLEPRAVARAHILVQHADCCYSKTSESMAVSRLQSARSIGEASTSPLAHSVAADWPCHSTSIFPPARLALGLRSVSTSPASSTRFTSKTLTVVIYHTLSHANRTTTGCDRTNIVDPSRIVALHHLVQGFLLLSGHRAERQLTNKAWLSAPWRPGGLYCKELACLASHACAIWEIKLVRAVKVEPNLVALEP